MRTLWLLSLLLLAPFPAAALPLVVGFGDSITSTTFDQAPPVGFCGSGCFVGGSYLDQLGPGFDTEDQGVAADLTDDMVTRVASWIGGGNTADVAVLLAGTPDTFQLPGYFGGVYSEALTVTNVAAIVDSLLGAGIPTILVAPPSAEEPCDNVSFSTDGNLSCATVQSRLASLATALAPVASTRGIPFLDAYALFDGHPGGAGALLRSGDGIHPNLAGDIELATALVPLINSVMLAPEPSTGLLLGSGLLVLGARRRRDG